MTGSQGRHSLHFLDYHEIYSAISIDLHNDGLEKEVGGERRERERDRERDS